MLSIEEIIEIADTQVFEHQGKHLNDLQRVILEETLKGKSYHDIAEKHNFTEKYIKDSASKLWQCLTKLVGEKVNKFNVRSTLDRYSFDSTRIANTNIGIQINSGNLFEESVRSKKTKQIQDKKDNNIPHENLTEAPGTEDFYGRERELSLLQTKILEEKCNLIILLGIRGIGKTALALELVNRIKPKFDLIIYKSLHLQTTLTELITEIIDPNIDLHDDITQDNSTYQLSHLKKSLAQRRYLIILDDVNCVFKNHSQNQQLSGEYQLYSNLFKLLSSVKTQSCVILISSERIPELSVSTNNCHNTFSWELSGLGADAVNLLKKYQLKHPQTYQTLIDIYEGNPRYLQIIAHLIQDLFAYDTNKFLQLQQPCIDIELTTFLKHTLEGLSSLETEILKFIANQSGSIPLTDLENHYHVHQDVVNSIQSLKRRYLLSTQLVNERVILEISPVIKKFLSG
ncbi:ATP-binding protein [Cylindrospermopsis raciborskii]|uniref:NB-ARC domain-containing protein n=1 Tax=Cylindrospermopsis raciborskii TaxID=77022 RepID=UPI000C1BC3B5|nr:ATP-binding protein [Cylindrospermopsis raciborskii]MCZ2207735.1 ATP-binding protein [Cylindrospermopsis raciborskii PAMP2011]